MASYGFWGELCCAGGTAGPRPDELVFEDAEKQNPNDDFEYVDDLVSEAEPDLASPNMSPSQVDKKARFKEDGSESQSTRASSASESDVSQHQSPVTKDRRRTSVSRRDSGEIQRAKEQVFQFLEKNGFKSVDHKKKGLGGLFCTYPLHVAADQNDVKMVGYLLRSGADLNLKDGRGRTAADCIKSKSSHAEVYSVLQAWREKGSVSNRRCSHWDAFFMHLESHPHAHRPGGSP
mmetsp:Transcript_11415/g.27431  ORF Transcript_11415/g.27431 Transcript_11415/m.27431 type:complete len:234 (+) Transcript_11415:88-789(+)